MGGGDEGGVVVPAGPGAALEVVESESGFQFPVVVFDAPADFGQAHEFLEGCVGVEGGEPVVGGFFCAGGPFGEQPAFGQAAVVGWGDVAVCRADTQGEESGAHRRGRVVGVGLGAVAPGHRLQGGAAGGHGQVPAGWCGSR